MNQTILKSILAASLFLGAGCRPDAIVDNIGINLNVKSADIDADGNFVTEKNISTEVGNPYGLFLGELKAQTGEEPFTITLEGATISLGEGAQASLEDLYVGVVTLDIVDDSAGTDTTIATVEDPIGVGPIDLEINFDAFEDELFQATLRDGSFKMRLSGASTDPSANINADVELSLSFSANQ